MPAKIDLDNIRGIIGETSTFPVLIEEGDLASAEVIGWIDEFGAYAEENHQEITGVKSPATLIRRYNNGEIPGNDYEIREIL